jgi:murein L,D-transpeptidase YcbB/YkuD
MAAQLRRLAAAAHTRRATAPRPPLAQAIERLYGWSDWSPLWLGPSGRPRPAAQQALAALASADHDGLDPADYGAAPLAQLADSLLQPGPVDPEAAARFDVGLSVGLLAFVRDLHTGRVDPRAAGFRLDLPADRHDLPGLLFSAAADGRVTETLDELRPQVVLYAKVRDALARYRALAAEAAWDTIPVPASSVRPGASLPWLHLLRTRLVLLGDLEADAAVGDSIYDGPVVDAVRRFQERHGLEPHGVLDRATIGELNVPPARRVRQLVLALERLRWLPDLGPGRLIAVNIPSFHLWAWDSLSVTATPALRMNVIVGRQALDTQTPVFLEEMHYVVFRPYWDVPPGILRREILPALRRNPGYLEANDMEIVQGVGQEARAVALTPETLDQLAAGRLRVRQRPGPRNAMGLVKFIFPNDANVYLHGTPAHELFAHARRAFSHGCVRVQHPVELAEFVLRGVPGWNRERIVAAMRSGPPTRVNLARPIPVLLFYTTAIVTPEGQVGFYHDLYGHDARLERYLRGG